MDSYIKRKAKGYSLGMKQKLGIALALVNFPELVILDEPMNGLDPQATKDLRDLIITESQRGTTFLISSHILSELQRLAQDLLIIDEGSIVQQTTMHELLASQGKQTIMLMTSDDNKTRQLLKKKPSLQRRPIRGWKWWRRVTTPCRRFCGYWLKTGSIFWT